MKLKFNREKNTNWLAFGAELIYLLIIFIVPLYFSVAYPTYNVFEFGKLAVFKVLSLCLFGLTIIRLGADKSFAAFWRQSLTRQNWRRQITIPLIFVLGLGLSVVLAKSRQLALFGSYSRQAGYLNYLYYLGFFWSLILNLGAGELGKAELSQKRFNNRLKRSLVAISCSSGLVALYGILQSLGIDFLTWPEDPLITGRAFSSLGQVNFLASWLLLVIPVSLYLAQQARSGLGRFTYLLLASCQFLALYLSASRGGLISAVVVGGIWGGYLLKKHFNRRGRWVVILLVALGLSLIIGSQLDRWQELVSLKTGSPAAHLDIYQASLSGLALKPAWGYGLDNLQAVFIKYYQPEWGIHSNLGVKIDRAHNLVLDIILQGGIWALGLFILLYYHFFRLAYLARNRQAGLSMFLAGGVLAYLGSLMFSFSFSVGDIYFFLFLALVGLVATIDYSISPETSLKPGLRRGARLVIVLGVVGLLSGALVVELKNWQADHYFWQTYKAAALAQPELAWQNFKLAEAGSLDPINQEFYRQYVSNYLNHLYSQTKLTEDRQILTARLNELLPTLSDEGLDAWLAKGETNLSLGNYDLAKQYFNRLVTESPYYPAGYLGLARVLAAEENFPAAIAYYLTTLEILPQASDERFNEEHRQVLLAYQQGIFESLGEIFLKLGDYQLAQNYFKQAYESNPQQSGLLKKIADTYYLLNNQAMAIKYLQHGYSRQASDYAWPLSLALIYQEQGERELFEEYFNQAKLLAPESKDLLQLIGRE